MEPDETVDIQWLARRYETELGIDIRPYVPDGCAELTVKVDEHGVKRFEPLVVGDASMYEQLSRFDWYYQDAKQEFRTAARVTVGRDVLEVGAGRGAFAAHAQASTYVGLDTNPAAVDAARRSGVDVRNLELDAYLADAGAGQHEVVCAFQVLEHVPDYRPFLRSMAAACRPGGWVVVSVPAENAFVGLADDNILNLPPHHQTRWTPEAFASVAPEVDLSLFAVVHEDLDPLHVPWARDVLLSAARRVPEPGSQPGPRQWLASRIGRRLVGFDLPSLDEVTLRCLKGHTLTVILRARSRGHGH